MCFVLTGRSSVVAVDACLFPQLLYTLTPEEAAGASRFVCGVVSTRGKYAYGLTEENLLCCFSLEEHRMVAASKVGRDTCPRCRPCPVRTHASLIRSSNFWAQASEADAIGMAHHPHLNLVATYSGAGVLRTWSA